MRANNCERFKRESGSRYMSDLGQVSVIITGWTGMQCLIAAFYPSYSPILLSACTYSVAIFRGGHSSPEKGKKHLSLIWKHYSASSAIIIVLKLDMVTVSYLSLASRLYFQKHTLIERITTALFSKSDNENFSILTENDNIQFLSFRKLFQWIVKIVFKARIQIHYFRSRFEDSKKISFHFYL